MNVQEIVLRLNLKPAGDLGKPFKDIGTYALAADPPVSKLRASTTQLQHSMASLGTDVARSLRSFGFLGKEAAASMGALAEKTMWTNREMKRLDYYMESVSGKSRYARPAPGQGGAGMGGLAALTRLGGSALLAREGGFDVANLLALQSGNKADWSQGILGRAGNFAASPVTAIGRQTSGVARMEEHMARDQAQRTFLQEQLQKSEAVWNIRRPHIEQTRALAELGASYQTSAAGSRIEAGRLAGDFGLQRQQERFGEALGHAFQAPTASRFGAGLADVMGQFRGIQAGFNAQGYGSAQTQRAVYEAGFGRERASGVVGQLDREIATARTRQAGLDARANAARDARDAAEAEARRKGGIFPEMGAYVARGIQAAGGPVPHLDQVKGRRDSAQAGFDIAKGEQQAGEERLRQLIDQQVAAKQRLLEAERNYGQAQQANSAAERERLMHARELTKETAKGLRDFAFGERQRVQSGKEDFAMQDPLSKQRAISYAERIKAGGRLNFQEAGFLKGQGLFQDVYRDYAAKEAERDPLTRKALQLGGAEQKAQAAEQAAKEASKFEVELTNKITAEINVNGPQLAQDIADKVAQQLVGLQANLAVQLQGQLMKLFQLWAANQRA